MVSPELAQMYLKGGSSKREAGTILLETITSRLFIWIELEALKAITINCPDYETLLLIQAARRLYKPAHMTIDIDLALSRRMADVILI